MKKYIMQDVSVMMTSWNGNGFRVTPPLWITILIISCNNKKYIMQEVSVMMTSCNGNGFRVTPPLWGESTDGFPSQRTGYVGFDVSFDVNLNKRLNKPASCRWFETSWGSLWCHCNVTFISCCNEWPQTVFLPCFFKVFGNSSSTKMLENEWLCNSCVIWY